MKKKGKKLVILCSFLLFGISTLNAQKWHTDFDEAKSLAQKGNKKIILVFKGSDWNGTCIRLKNKMWSNPEFQEYAKRKENKLSKEQLEKNNKLIDTYNRSRVIPLVVVLDKEGNLLGTTGYKDVDADKYIELLNFFEGS